MLVSGGRQNTRLSERPVLSEASTNDVGLFPHEVARTPQLLVLRQRNGKDEFSGMYLQIMRNGGFLQGCTLGPCKTEAFSQRANIRRVVSRQMARAPTIAQEERHS